MGVSSGPSDLLHRRRAQRTARRLLEANPPAQAVVGPLGSGKTTLCHLVEEAIQAAGGPGSSVSVVRVELWPYQTPEAAVEGIIHALVNELEAEVPVGHLRGLPRAYADAMTRAGGAWCLLAALHGAQPSLVERLQAIDEVAVAIGRGYVLWVEDLERFAGRAAEGSEPLEDSERLIPAQRLPPILLALVRRRTPERPDTWQGEHSTPPGLIPLRRIWLQRSRRGEASRDMAAAALQGAYEICTPRNLRLADELEHWFVVNGAHDFLRGDEAGRAALKTHLRALLVEHFVDRPDALADALAGAQAATLLRISWGLERVRANDFSGLPFDSWPQLSQTVLEACAARPADMLPQVAHLVCHSDDEAAGLRRPQPELDEELAARLFGSAEDVLKVFSAAELPTTSLTPEVEAVLRAAGGAKAASASVAGDNQVTR